MWMEMLYIIFRWECRLNNSFLIICNHPILFQSLGCHYHYWGCLLGEGANMALKLEWKHLLKRTVCTLFGHVWSCLKIDKHYSWSIIVKIIILFTQTSLILFGHINMFGHQTMLDHVCLNQTSPNLLQLLRPFDYKCPRLLELLAKSKQDKEYLDMAKQNEVSLVQTIVRVVWLDIWSTLSTQRPETLSDPPDPLHTPPQKKEKKNWALIQIWRHCTSVCYS